MSANSEVIQLTKELKVLLLTILKNGSISANDVAKINQMGGFELANFSTLSRMTDEELDSVICELHKKLEK